MKKLLFVLSCYHKDVGEGLELTRWMRELGTECADRALLVTTKQASNMPEVGQILQNLEMIFRGGVDHCPLVIEDERGPWFSNNFMFRSVAKHVEHLYKDIDGWYNFEPDCLPLRKDWWEQIKTAFRACEKPFMGDVRPVSGEQNAPLHLNGSAIYPQNVAKYSVMALRAQDQPWDYYAREEIVPQSQHTLLIQTLFNTINYREVDGKVWTRYVRPGGQKGIQDEGAEVAVSDEAVIVHGCKDGSLRAILRARLTSKRVRAIPAPLAKSKGRGVTELVRNPNANENISKALRNKRSLAKVDLTPEEERSVTGLITALELFCRNDQTKQRVLSMLGKSELMAA